MKRKLTLLALASLGVLAMAGIALASGGEGGADHHGVPWGNFILRVINFVIFAGIIWWAAGKKIIAFFGDRKAQIQNELDDLSGRQAEAEQKLKNVEAGIAGLEKEKQSILDEAKAQGEALKAAIIAKAEKDAEALKEQAKRSAADEAKVALDSIRAEMAELVVEAATKIVQDKLTEKDHDQLVDEYLTKVVLN
ncbi:MAG: F0F1 ATP synthase subunit B [Desulfovibrionaceae bacterium]